MKPFLFSGEGLRRFVTRLSQQPRDSAFSRYAARMRRIALLGSALLALTVLVRCGSPVGAAVVDASSGDASDDVWLDPFPEAAVDAGAPCKNLQCQQVVCAAGKTTTITGQVVTPTASIYGKPDPVYDAIVYVPNGPVAAMPSGMSCDDCGPPLSTPLVAAATLVSGRFILGSVPIGKSIPLVVQSGHWRKQLTIDVSPCVDNPLPEPIALPSTTAEGDLPRIAIATSDSDPIECLLRKMGIADSEFTTPSGSGHVHLFHGDGATLPGAPDKSALYASLSTLKPYDSRVPSLGQRPGHRGRSRHRGRRAFGLSRRRWASLHHRTLLLVDQGQSPAVVGRAVDGVGALGAPVDVTASTLTPYGADLGKWLAAAGALANAPNPFPISSSGVIATAQSSLATFPALSSTSPPSLQAFAFDAPVGGNVHCGRAVYASFNAAAAQSGAGKTFPAECDAKPLTPQEKAFEYFLFAARCTVSPPQLGGG